MTTLERVPLPTQEAQDIMEHVNGGHVPELLLCARAFTPVSQPTHTQVSAVFLDGMQLEITAGSGSSSHFVPYSVTAPAHEAIRATVQAAYAKLGEKPNVPVSRWPVLENRPLTAHFRRDRKSVV